MKVILPRVIFGNLGDLSSRWGILRALQLLGIDDVVVFSRVREDVPHTRCVILPYRPVRNLLQDVKGIRHYFNSDIVLWAVGLDMQDDSSLAKLIYLNVLFSLFRLMGLRVWMLFQGAGPITTKTGLFFAKRVLKKADIFVARDPGTYTLIKRVSSTVSCELAHDAIFLPGFEDDVKEISSDDEIKLTKILGNQKLPVVGLNFRQWFHFSSSLMPYQFSKKSYYESSLEKMADLIKAMKSLVSMLRDKLNVRVILISAYQPGVVPWEDDLSWLQQIKSQFDDDHQVELLDQYLSMPAYYSLFSKMDIVVGMRLHSSLIALRMGVPSVNISYTLKGNDIMRHLGLAKYVVDLNHFIDDPALVYQQVVDILSDLPGERKKVAQSVQGAVDQNMMMLRRLIDNAG